MLERVALLCGLAASGDGADFVVAWNEVDLAFLTANKTEAFQQVPSYLSSFSEPEGTENQTWNILSCC